MFQPDAGNHRHIAAGHSGRVQTASHTRFQHGHLNALLPEIQETDYRQHFKERGFHMYRLSGGFHLQQKPVQVSLAYGRIVHPNSLPQAYEMRAGVEPRLDSVGLQNSREVIAARAFPVGSHHMNGAESLLRVAQGSTDLERRLETWHHAKHQARFQIFHTFRNHGP